MNLTHCIKTLFDSQSHLDIQNLQIRIYSSEEDEICASVCVVSQITSANYLQNEYI